MDDISDQKIRNILQLRQIMLAIEQYAASMETGEKRKKKQAYREQGDLA